MINVTGLYDLKLIIFCSQTGYGSVTEFHIKFETLLTIYFIKCNISCIRYTILQFKIFQKKQVWNFSFPELL